MRCDECDGPLTPEELDEIRRNAETCLQHHHEQTDCGSYFATGCLALLDRLATTEAEMAAQAAVIARYRDGWRPVWGPNWERDKEYQPMTDAERQVLYPAGPQPTEGTTP